jgi:hypothetical protein
MLLTPDVEPHLIYLARPIRLSGVQSQETFLEYGVRFGRWSGLNSEHDKTNHLPVV